MNSWDFNIPLGFILSLSVRPYRWKVNRYRVSLRNHAETQTCCRSPTDVKATECFHAYTTLVWLFQITKLMHNSFILQQYVCYITILNIFRAAPCSSSGGQIVLLQPLVSSLSVNSGTVCRLRADSVLNLHTVRLFTESNDTRGCSNTICPPEDEQGAARKHVVDRNVTNILLNKGIMH